MQKTCSNCAYFGTKNPETNILDPPHRRTLEEGWLVVGGDKRFVEPGCRLGHADLYDELDGNITFDSFLVVIRKDRSDCPGFDPRLPGRSPKEHEEMLSQAVVLDLQKQMAVASQQIASVQSDYLSLRKEQAERETEQAQRIERLTKQIEALREVRHQETQRGDDRRKKWEVKAIIIGSVIGAAAVILTAVLSTWLTHHWIESSGP